MKIFVTGGAGFIGSSVVKALIEQHHRVTVFDNLSSGTKEAVDLKANLIVGDLQNKNLLSSSLADHDIIFHFAGLIEADESVKNPQAFYNVNTIGGINLLEAARKNNIKKIIFSSSASVYLPQKYPLLESSPTFPDNPYGATKLAFESLMSAYYFSYKIEIVALRYFNAYGPGERHLPETHAIPIFINSILKDNEVPVYWKGDHIRDFIYIDDLVAAHILTLKTKGINVFNIGTGQGTKIIDLLKMIAKILNKKPKIKDVGQRQGDPKILVASFKKINRELGWEPKEPLEKGLQKTIIFFKSQLF